MNISNLFLSNTEFIEPLSQDLDFFVCSNNYLTRLPALPYDLEYIRYENNPLPERYQNLTLDELKLLQFNEKLGTSLTTLPPRDVYTLVMFPPMTAFDIISIISM
jgi:hypothetical protein